MCTREIALMRRLDRAGRIEFVDVGARDAVCPIDRADLLAMWRAIPLLRPLGLLARWRPALRLLERAYVAFLRVRPRLQRLVA